MRISIVTALALLCLTLTAGTAWAYSASVHIYVYNDDNETMDVIIDGSDSAERIFTLDSGDDHEYEASATAWLWDAVTYSYSVYVSADDGSDSNKCNTSISVVTEWDFGVKIYTCSATAAETTACTIEADTYGTTCQITVTINE